MRYMLIQPERLDSRATTKLALWITLQAQQLIQSISKLQLISEMRAEAELTSQIKEIRRYLHMNLPKYYLNTLVNEAMRMLTQLNNSYEKSSNCINFPGEYAHHLVSRRMIEALITYNLTSLDLNQDRALFPLSFIGRAHELTGLTHLKISLMAFAETDIIKMVKELHSLKYIFLQYCCTENILRCIARYCPSIEELDLAYSSINDSNKYPLNQLHNLRIINLLGTSVGLRGIASLLLTCTKLEDTGSIYVALALGHIQSCPEYAGEMFQLKTYSGHNISLKLLQIVVQMCPLIQNLALNKRLDWRSNLLAVIDLQHLRNLKIEGYNYYTDQVRDVLQARGWGLSDLHLEKVNQIDINALKDINQMCPNLRTLAIDNCDFIYCTSPCTKPSNVMPFKYLTKLTWDTSSKLFSYADEYIFVAVPVHVALAGPELAKMLELWFFMLSNCLNVEYLDFGKSVWLTEEIMLAMLEKNPLTHLKELKMRQSVTMPFAITSEVVNRITRNSINTPEVILLMGP